MPHVTLMLPRICRLVVLLGFAFQGSHPVAFAGDPVAFYVSPSGDDRNPGTEVSPFRSIERAQAAIRPLTESMTADIVVFLRGGTYQLADTLRFDARDSGLNGFRVVYRSVPGEQAALSGGRSIIGWTAAPDGLFQAEVDGRRFRQLYIDGVRATRARTPNEPDYLRLVRWDEKTRRIVVKAGSVESWENLSAVEMVISQQWKQNNLRLESWMEHDGDVFIAPREPDRTKAFIGHLFLRLEGQSYFFENALEFLDAPGEWYLRVSTGQVFYKPRAGEDLSRATVVAPVLERLVEIRGTPGQPVHDLLMLGLAFEYAGWTLPTHEGFVPRQADSIYLGTDPLAGRMPAAVHVEHAHHVQFEGNSFRHLGGTALSLFTGVSDARVVGNAFRDLSASGIVIDGALEARPLDPRIVCRDNLVANNLIERIGLDYRSSVGIFAGFVNRLTIEHNEIHDTPYTGISVGWGWTDEPTALGHNLIRGNRISSAMKLMADGAGIYTLSNQPGSVIHENYVHDLVRSPGAGHSSISGIYLDEGSSGITLSDNVLERVPLGIFFHRASHNVVVNTAGSYEELNGAEDNVFRQEAGFDLVLVKGRTGLEPAYAGIRSQK